jgi:large subunit ribosomal protein L23
MSVAKTFSPKLYDVIISPVVTEKSTALLEQNKVVFKVRNDSNKASIKQAVEHIFDVTVESVNTLTIKGKTKRFRGIAGKRKDIKKAIVTLKAGDHIDFAAKV